MDQDVFILKSLFDIFNENPIPIKWTTTPIMREVILSPVINQLMKKAASDGIVIIAPISELFKKMPFVGRGLSLLLSTIV